MKLCMWRAILSVSISIRLLARVKFTMKILHDRADILSDYAQLAEIVEEVTGSKVRKEIWDLPSVRKEWASDKDDGLKKYRVVFTEGVGCSWDMSKTFNAKKAIKVEDVRTWAGKHLQEKARVAK